MKKIIVLLTFILTMHVNSYAADQGHEGHDHPKNDGKITTPELLTEALDGDILYGEKDAPVTIVEYASLSCGHCAKFYTETFGKLRDNYISKGKVKLVYRHYPLNAPALQATMLVECVADNNAKQVLLGKLFVAQEKWAYSNNFTAELGNIAKDSGIKSESIFDCIADTKKQDALLGLQLKAQQGLSVQATPTLFINDKLYGGNKSYDEISKYIDGLLQTAKEDSL